MTLGLQVLRALFPLIVHGYGGRPGVTTTEMGLLALAIFLTAPLVVLPVRRLGEAATLRAAAAALVASRLLVQVTGPEAMLWLAAAGAVGFLWTLPLLLVGPAAAAGPRGQAAAVLLGVGLDAAIAAAYWTWDVSWQRTAGPTAVAVLLCGACAWSVRATARGGPARPEGSTASWGLAGLGPLLLLVMLLVGNTARLTAASGAPLPAVLALQAVALAAAVAAAWRAQAAGTLVAAAALPVAVGLAHAGGLVALAGGAAGTMAAGPVLAALMPPGPERAPARPVLLPVAWGLGTLLFVGPAFVYYVAYDRRLPFENAVIPPLLGVLAALCAFPAVRAMRLPGATGPARALSPPAAGWGPAPAAAALLAVALALALAPAPRAVPGAGWPVRVMSYNLHQGYAPSGMQDLEALARTVEAAGAEVVALQEVSRGWLINGSTDTLTWFARRLGMVAAWGPAADAGFGNAILSRRPITSAGHTALPRVGMPMRRGALWAAVDLGGGEALLVIATHLHHVEAHGHVRELQAFAVANLWHERPRAVVLGDFNATPEATEIEVLRRAGLRDTFVLAGQGQGFTYSSTRPERRIDYIFVSPDLLARDFRVLAGTASDHLGIAVTLTR